MRDGLRQFAFYMHSSGNPLLGEIFFFFFPA